MPHSRHFENMEFAAGERGGGDGQGKFGINSSIFENFNGHEDDNSFSHNRITLSDDRDDNSSSSFSNYSNRSTQIDTSSSFLSFTKVTSSNITTLKRLNIVLFPMQYQERYYKDVIALDSFSRLVYWQDFLIGTFSCRMQTFTDENRKLFMECYLMTFGILHAYRRRSFGTLMLANILQYCLGKRELKRITLHVHTTNKPAIAFYEQHGFKRIRTVDGYYKKLSPTTAYLYQLDFL